MLKKSLTPIGKKVYPHTLVMRTVPVVHKHVSCTAMYAACAGNYQPEYARKAEPDLERPPSSSSVSDLPPEIQRAIKTDDIVLWRIHGS